ncbi:MAG: ATP-dependent DNA helicase UvrD/PcrA/Rep, epsilon proteobacterial type 1 [uncultured Sulfurovum sp.]|uniref:DNA 3'-5' helicase n=1 Tax=uncultured Sulfurovum sp. TaxID=269237 RepID=A0A6S6SEJ3_9BACT|nr:MAG: ATP-dependent DNA helicase UvrD/PcrA/Rep, epsilon proteobacterial type 1 [uncultured Sulfurovum sp.]
MPLSTLNEEQLSAATAPIGNNLIIASAGTGKTSTIVGRIAHLLQNGTEPSKILLLTFTNKAAGEMLARVGRYYPASIVNKIESGTFHAVSYRWLKEMNANISLKQPGELKTLFRSVYEKRQMKRLNLDTEPFSSTYLYEQYSLYQNASLDGFDVWFTEKYPDHKPLIDIYMNIIDDFEETKDKYGFVSFNDLLLKMKAHLQEHGRDLVEVLVDEYQDTNTLQSALIDSMTPNSLFCVGDYDQSIYAFNGANIQNIATFGERYPNATVFTLDKNYRSSGSILSLANRVIERNERIYPKKLVVTRTGKNQPPKLLMHNELFDQYQGIAKSIKQTYTPTNDIAVIFRNNASGDGIEASLREMGIPSKRKGGNSFFEAKEVKFLLDVCSLIVNPKDMMAFIHIFEYGKNIGSAVAKEMFECFRHFGEGNLFIGLMYPRVHTLPKLNPNKNMQLGLFDDDAEIGSVTRFAKIPMSEKIRSHPILKYPKLSPDGLEFFKMYHEFMSSISNIKQPRSLLVKLVQSPLYNFLVELLATQRGRLKSGEIDQEKKNLAKERIARKARLLIDLSSQYKEISRFVNAMVLGGNELSEGDGVNLLSIHASKGLEFTEVYVVDLMDGRFPNTKLMGKGGSLDEERRLFYVAVTRAKEKLYLSFAKHDRVKKLDFKPSPFLYEAKMLKEN